MLRSAWVTVGDTSPAKRGKYRKRESSEITTTPTPGPPTTSSPTAYNGAAPTVTVQVLVGRLELGKARTKRHGVLVRSVRAWALRGREREARGHGGGETAAAAAEASGAPWHRRARR